MREDRLAYYWNYTRVIYLSYIVENYINSSLQEAKLKDKWLKLSASNPYENTQIDNGHNC